MYKYLVLVCSIFLISCVHNPFLSLGKKISMNLIGELNHRDDYAVFSQVLVENFKDNQLVSQKIDIVNFNVINKITLIDGLKNIHVEEHTVSKDGTMSLHDMAYPELNEKINFVFNRFGNVLKAGKYAQGSLFFTPPLPLPQRKVGVGDVWQYSGEWKSSALQSAVKLQLTLKIKKLVSCYLNETCAGVEWHGDVTPATQGMHLPIASKIQGYTFYRPKTGSQLWSYMRNTEVIGIQNLKLVISSCVQSILKNDASGLNPHLQKDPYCDPSKNELALFE